MDDIKIFEGDEILDLNSFTTPEELELAFGDYAQLLVPEGSGRVVAASTGNNRIALWDAYKARFPDAVGPAFTFLHGPKEMRQAAAATLAVPQL